MAQAGDTFERGRRETIDPTSGGAGSAEGGHLGGYIGLAIAGFILVAMVLLQEASPAIY